MVVTVKTNVKLCALSKSEALYWSSEGFIWSNSLSICKTCKVSPPTVDGIFTTELVGDFKSVTFSFNARAEAGHVS